MQIAAPCHEDWNRMTPNAQGRHCATCDQPVVDLSGLDIRTRRERLATIATTVASGKRVCVRGRIDRDGMLAGSRRVLTGGMAVILAMTMAGCQGDGPAVVQQQAPTHQQTPAPTPNTDPVAGGIRAMPIEKGDVATPTPAPTRAMMGEMCVPEPIALKGKIAAPAPTPVSNQ